MSADTKDLVNQLSKAEKAIGDLNDTTDGAKNGLDDLGKKSKETGGDLDNLSKDADKTGSSLGGMAGTAGKVAGSVLGIATAVAGAAAAFVAYAKVQAQAMRETEAMADAAGVSIAEFKAMSFALQTVGFDAEKFGDITKDTQERIGDFLSTGGGPFQDFADVMGYTKDEATKLAAEFEMLSGPQVLQEMVTRMQEGGVSAQKMSFALEGMASDTTRLIPLLENGGVKMKALNEQFNAVNVELSDDERAQFEQLAQNVDLAQTAFVNFLNNAITPFLPLISEAAIKLSEFFAATQLDADLSDILDEPATIKQIRSIEVLTQLEDRLGERRLEARGKYNKMRTGETARDALALKAFQSENAELAKLDELVKQQVKSINERNAELRKTPDVNVGTIDADTGGDASTAPVKTGVDNAKELEGLQESLQAYRDSQKTKLELLEEDKNAQLAVADKLARDDQQRADLRLEIDRQYLERKKALEDEQAPQLEKLEAQLQAEEDASLSRLQVLENERAARLAIAQTMVTDKQELKALEDEIEQSFTDKRNELVQSEEGKRAEQFSKQLSEQQEFLNNKLISEEEYQQRLDELTEQYRPQQLDSSILQEQYQAELDLLQEQLNGKLIVNEEYLKKLNALDDKYKKKDESRKKKAEFWSKSEVKTNLDAGTQILGALGSNSKKAFKIKQGLSAASAVMNTSEGVTKALADQNYAGAAVTAATGIAQLAAILSASPDGGGGNITPTSGSSSTSNTGPTFTGEPTSTTVTDITELDGSQQSTERFIIEFSDDVVDAVARKVKQSENDGRV